MKILSGHNNILSIRISDELLKKPGQSHYVEATRDLKGQSFTEIRYYLSSLPVDAECDGPGIRPGPARMAISLNYFPVNLIRAITIQVKRLKAGLDDDYLAKVLTS